jgi:hypothetical protein
MPVIVQVGDTKVEVRAEAVLSGPRFGPLINIFGFVEAMMPLHIRPAQLHPERRIRMQEIRRQQPLR